MVSSWLFAVSKQHQKEQKMHWGDEMHSNMDEYALLRQGFVNPILPSVKANLSERIMIMCCHEFLTIEGSLVCHVPLPKWSLRCQITDPSNPMIR